MRSLHVLVSALSAAILLSACGAGNGSTPTSNTPDVQTRLAHGAVVSNVPHEYLYAANYGSDNVSAYAIRANGALSAVTGSPFTAGTQPAGVAIAPGYNFLYTANEDSNNVSGYSINVANGALTPVSGSPFGAGDEPFGIAIHPTGKFVYVANYQEGNVSGYTINTSTGNLTQIAGSPFGSEQDPDGMAVTPTASSST